jgi:hypothetical protein
MKHIAAAIEAKYPRTYSLACSVLCMAGAFFLLEKDNHNDWLHWGAVAAYILASIYLVFKAMSPLQRLLVVAACVFGLVYYIDHTVAVIGAVLLYAVWWVDRTVIPAVREMIKSAVADAIVESREELD